MRHCAIPAFAPTLTAVNLTAVNAATAHADKAVAALSKTVDSGHASRR